MGKESSLILQWPITQVGGLALLATACYLSAVKPGRERERENHPLKKRSTESTQSDLLPGCRAATSYLALKVIGTRSAQSRRRLATISSVKLFPTVFTFPPSSFRGAHILHAAAISSILLKRGFCFDVEVANEVPRPSLHSGDLTVALPCCFILTLLLLNHRPTFSYLIRANVASRESCHHSLISQRETDTPKPRICRRPSRCS